MKSLKFFKPTLGSTLAIVLASLISVRPAQAGYNVTLQEIGPDVVATGSGVIDLTGLSKLSSLTVSAGLLPSSPVFPFTVHFAIYTGATTTIDSYSGSISLGAGRFGSGSVFTPASSGSGDMVGIFKGGIAGGCCGPFVYVPAGYVSGTALSDSATYNNATFATLGVTPGTYVWTWGPGANQNFTLLIIPTPTPAPTATPSPGQSSQIDGEGTIAGPNGRQVQFFIQDVENEQVTADLLKGEFGYSDNRSRVTFTTGKIQTVTINGNLGTFTGMASIGGKRKKQVQFTVSVAANQIPATGDTFSISLSNGYRASGNLTSGSITIH